MSACAGSAPHLRHSLRAGIRLLTPLSALLIVATTHAAGTSDLRSARIHYALEGRADGAYARGTIVIAPGVRAGTRMRVMLQQREARNGRVRWRDRARVTVRLHRRTARFVVRWRRPPAGRVVFLRISVYAGRRLVGRSATNPVRAGDPGTVFYSGEGDAGAGDVGDNVIRLVASFGFLGLGPHYDGRWTSSVQCDPSSATPSRASIGSEPITELAGFSLGRLGPIYFLRKPPAWAAQIDYVLLLDPGSSSDMQPCDPKPSIAPATALAGWLARRATNQLVIIAGPATLSDNYAGLDQRYLSALAPDQRRQVLICYKTSPAHPAFLESQNGGFGWMVGAPPPATCPSGTHERRWSIPGGGGGSTSPPTRTGTSTPPPAPLPAGEFYVQNADGGIYWRSAPDWNAAEASPGNGFYSGTVIKPTCHAIGAANVPGSTDAMWEQASRVSGPGSGSGWINEHFIADNQPINQPSPGVPACQSASPPPPPPQTWSEQETPNHPVNTFTNYHNASGMGPAIAAGLWVQVSCKAYDPTIQSVNPDGYWYRIASAPWSNAYYSPANTFMNGDPYGGPYTHNTDFAVPNC
jgi:hypothetical protein